MVGKAWSLTCHPVYTCGKVRKCRDFSGLHWCEGLLADGSLPSCLKTLKTNIENK